MGVLRGVLSQYLNTACWRGEDEINYILSNDVIGCFGGIGIIMIEVLLPLWLVINPSGSYVCSRSVLIDSL